MKEGPPAGSRGRLLVVEDEWIIAKDLQSMLVAAGYDVPAVATSVEDFEPIYRAVQPDLVLMDIALGGRIDGIAAMQRLGAQGPVPVLYVSAHADRPTVERASAETLALGFVVKPFSERQLLAAVDVALAKLRDSTQVQARAAVLEDALNGIAGVLTRAGVWVDPPSGVRSRIRAIPELASLSPRESEVLRLLVELRKVSRVADELHLSPNTVRNHLKSIFGKLDVGSQDELLDKVEGRS